MQEIEYDLLLSVLKDFDCIAMSKEFNFSVDYAPVLVYDKTLDGPLKITLHNHGHVSTQPYREMSNWEHNNLISLLKDVSGEPSIDGCMFIFDNIFDWIQSLWGVMEWNNLVTEE